jgi:hypothetical protein
LAGVSIEQEFQDGQCLRLQSEATEFGNAVCDCGFVGGLGKDLIEENKTNK